MLPIFFLFSHAHLHCLLPLITGSRSAAAAGTGPDAACARLTSVGMATVPGSLGAGMAEAGGFRGDPEPRLQVGASPNLSPAHHIPCQGLSGWLRTSQDCGPRTGWSGARHSAGVLRHVPCTRPAVDEVEELYGHVDGLLHQLTLQSNQRVQALELVQMLEAQEGELHQVRTICPGGRHLSSQASPLPHSSSLFFLCTPPD